MRQTTPPTYIWRGLGLAAVLLLLLSVTTIALISAGIGDPGPAGTPSSRYALGPQQVAAGEARHTWVADVPGDKYIARLTAAHAGGEPDSGYGLMLGEEDVYFVAALSPLGYVAVWEQRGETRKMLFPWQTWPHVETGTNSNEIQVAVAGEEITIRVNRELLWQGRSSVPGTAAGVFSQSFGGRATIDFQTLSLYRLASE